MKSTIYKFDKKAGLLDSKIFGVTDYFQYYTTGVEQIIREAPDNFLYTDRLNGERPEQIMYGIFKDENLSDMFVAINNQNYIWAVPFDLDSFEEAVEFKMNYVKFLMKDRLDDPIQENIMFDRVSEDVHVEDDVSRTVIIPAGDAVPGVNRQIREYFKGREVK
jgi:hypothetical protein